MRRWFLDKSELYPVYIDKKAPKIWPTDKYLPSWKRKFSDASLDSNLESKEFEYFNFYIEVTPEQVVEHLNTWYNKFPFRQYEILIDQFKKELFYENVLDN